MYYVNIGRDDAKAFVFVPYAPKLLDATHFIIITKINKCLLLKWSSATPSAMLTVIMPVHTQSPKPRKMASFVNLTVMYIFM